MEGRNLSELQNKEQPESIQTPSSTPQPFADSDEAVDQSSTRSVININGQVEQDYLEELAQKAILIVKQKESDQIRKAIGFHIDADQKQIHVPEEFFHQSDTLAEVISILALRTNYEVFTFKSGLNCSVKQSEDDFAYGILRAVVQPDFCRFTTGKKERDLGFALTMALRMKCAFESDKRVDELTANDYYFGNNPNEKVYLPDKKKHFDVVYTTRIRISGIVTSSDGGDFFFRAISHFFKELQWSDVPAEVRDKYDLLYTKKFDEVVQFGWQYVYQKKGNTRQLAIIRKGSMPNRSSLFLKEEMKLLTVAMSPYFESLNDLKNHFFDQLCNLGLPAIKEMIQKVYKKRFAILEKFASETTRRLNQIRLLSPDLKSKKKKEVTNAMVMQLLSSRSNPAKMFFDEVRSIVGHDGMRDTLCAFESKYKGPPDTGSKILSNLIVETYAGLGIYKDKELPELHEVKFIDKYIKALETTATTVSGFRGSLSTTKRLIGRYLSAKTPEGRGYYRTPLFDNIEALLEKIDKLSFCDPQVIDIVERSSGTVTTFIDKYSIDASSLALHDMKHKYMPSFRGDTKTLGKEADATLLAAIKKARDAMSATLLYKSY